MGVSLKSFQEVIPRAKYLERHRKSEADFTRNRKLPFVSLLKFVLLKSVKSLQLRLSEFSDLLDEQMSASALSQARKKLCHTAFIELLEKCVVDVMYGDGDYKQWNGRRLLAIDGSTLRVPKSEETLEAYGHSERDNQQLVEGKLSVIYDMLNRIPLNASLHRGRTNDIVACQEQLSLLEKEDVVVADRGYDSYAFFAAIVERGADFVVRCTACRTVCRELIANRKLREQVVTIPAPESRKELPNELTLRFLRIPLPDGEVEILVTSLRDKKRFPYKALKKLYAKRWRIETYFQTLKGRLGLDNFSGKTKEAILQDLHACIFVSGLVTIFSEDANDELSNKTTTKFKQQVNNAVAFHAFKTKIVELIFDPPPDFAQQVSTLLVQNPTLVRPNRTKERVFEPRSASGKKRSLFYQKHLRKHVY